MDAVVAASEARGPDPRSKEFADALAGYEASVAGLRDSAQLARLTDDPAAPSLEAMVRLMAAAARQFEVRERERKEIAASLDMRARRIAEDATNQIQASGTAIIQRLAPELTRLVDRAVRQRLWTIRLRTVAISAVAGITLLLGAGAAAYIYGYRAGNAAGLLDGHMVNAAVAAGPGAPAAWAQIMAHNDPVPALQTCLAHRAKDAAGRAFCALPIWLEAAPAPGGKPK
jgi:hypothetical protein